MATAISSHVSLHYLPRYLRLTTTWGKTPTIVTWSEPCYCYATKNNSRRIRSQHRHATKRKCRGGLRLCGAPGWNLERSPFYNREKTNERTEVFVLLKQKILSKKKESSTNMDVTIWTKLIDFNSFYFLQEAWNHIDKCSQKTGGMFWMYSGTPSTTTPLSRPLRRGLPVLMHYLLFHYRDHPGHRRRQGGLGKHIVILCLERRYLKQNTVVCLKPSALAPRKFFWPLPNFWAGYATVADTLWSVHILNKTPICWESTMQNNTLSLREIFYLLRINNAK